MNTIKQRAHEYAQERYMKNGTSLMRAYAAGAYDERRILQLEDLRLVKHYEWCEREAARVPFLTPRERELYVKSLFSAVRWGKQH